MQAAQTVASLEIVKRISQGREAEIFQLEAGVALKLYRSASPDSRDREWVALKGLTAGIGPKPLGLETVAGRPGIRMELVDGRDLLTLIGTRPWLLPALGVVMGRAHARVHETPVEGALSELRIVMRERIRQSPHVPESHREAALNAIATLPDGDRLCHGDFHPGNLVRISGGARVLDWPNATVGDPHADLAASLVILAIGEPPETAPWAVRRLHRVGRGLLRDRYLAGYARDRAFDPERVRAWMLPAATDRLSHGIHEERRLLLALLSAQAR